MKKNVINHDKPQFLVTHANNLLDSNIVFSQLSAKLCEDRPTGKCLVLKFSASTATVCSTSHGFFMRFFNQSD